MGLLPLIRRQATSALPRTRVAARNTSTAAGVGYAEHAHSMKVPVETYPLLALVTVVSTCGIAVAVSTFRKDQGYLRLMPSNWTKEARKGTWKEWNGGRTPEA